jgi:hypothetical protein
VIYDKIVDSLPSSIKDIFNKASPSETPVVSADPTNMPDNNIQSLGLSLNSVAIKFPQ